MKSLTLLVSAALAVQKLSVTTWILKEEKLICEWTVLQQRSCVVSLGSCGILLTSEASYLCYNTFPREAFFLLCFPLPPQLVLLLPADSSLLYVSSGFVLLEIKRQFLLQLVSGLAHHSSAPASLAELRGSPWRSIWKSGKSYIGASPCSITIYTKHWRWFFCTSSAASFLGWWFSKCGLSWSWKLRNTPGVTVGIYQRSQEEK